MPERDRHIEDDARYGDSAPGREEPGDGAREQLPDETSGRRRGVGVRLLRGLGYVLGVVCVLFGAIVIFLQTGPGQDVAQQFLLKRLNALFDGAELTADDLSGSLVGNFALTNTALITADGDTLAYADTLQANYHLLYLLRNRLVLRDINLVDPIVWMRQQEDGSWDLFNVVARDDSVAVDTAETFWTRLVIEFDHLDLKNGQVIAEFYSADRDSVLRIRDLNLDIGESEFGEEIVLDLNLLMGEFAPPGQSYWATTATSGLVEGNDIRLHTFFLESPQSTVRAAGALRLPDEEVDHVDDVDFFLVADPLTFADIRSFIPGFEAQGSAEVGLRLEGSGRRLAVDADVAFSDGGVFAAEGIITPGGEGPVEYALDVTARRLNPRMLLGAGVENGQLNADVSVALEGTQRDQVTGQASAIIFDSNYGEYALGRSELTSQWEAGRAQFTLTSAMRGAGLSVNGAARPFDDMPTYDLDGRVTNLNLGNFAGDSNLTTDLGGRFSIEGRGLSGETIAMNAEVALAPSRINKYIIQDALATINWEGQALDFTGRVNVPEGNLSVAGGLNFEGDLLQYDVRRGRVENFDVAALLGQEDTPSSLTGNFTLEGRGTAPENIYAELAAELEQGFYGDIIIADVVARGTLNEGFLMASIVADLEQSGYFDVTLGTRPFDESLALTFRRGDFRDVNLALLAGTPSLQTDLTGSVEGTLRLGGSVVFEGRVDLAPSRINEQEINSAMLLADLSGENLDFDLAVNLPEGQASMVGTAQPFEAVPSYVVSDARFDNIDIGAFANNPSLRSDLSGTASVRGRGLSLNELTLSGRFNLNPSRINQQNITGASFAVDVNAGALDFAARVNLPEGQTRLAGTADLLADVPAYRIREGSFEHLNIGAFLGNPNLQTDLTGTLALQGRGFDPEAAYISGQVGLRASRINQQEINAASLVANLQGGDLDYALSLDLPEGEAQLSGEAQFATVPLIYSVDAGTFTGLNIGALANSPDMDTYLTGRIVRLEGQGFNLEEADLSARIELNESRINEQVIDSAYADVELNDGNLAFDVSLEVPEGETHLAGMAQLGADTLTYEVSEGSFNSLNLGALLGREDLQTNLTGTLSLAGRGFDPEAMALELDLDLQPSTINEGEIITGDVEALIQNGLVNLDADLVLPEGRAQVIGTVRPFLDEPEYDVAGTLIDANLADFLGTDTLQAYFNADFELQGVGFDPATAVMQGNVQATSSRFEGLAVDSLDAIFRLDEGLLDVDHLVLRSSAADVTAFGELALADTTGAVPSDFTFDATVKDAQAINPYLAPFDVTVGEGTVEGRAYTENRILRFDLDADLERVAYQSYRIVGLDGRVVGEMSPDRQLQLGEARVAFDFASVPGFNLQASQIDATLQGDLVVFDVGFKIDPQRDGAASGRLDLEAQQVQLETLQLRFETDTWELLLPATVTFGDAYRVSNFLLYTGDQQIAIDGVIDPGGFQNLILTVENFEIETVTGFLGYEGLAGTLDGSLAMTGPAADPVAEGTLFLDIVAQEEAIGDGSIALLYEDRQLAVDALLANATGGTLGVDGSIPIDLTLASTDTAAAINGNAVAPGLELQAGEPAPTSGVDLTVAANGFSIAWVEPFLSPEDFQELAGELNADIRITGTLEQPALEGQWALTQGNLSLPQIGIGLRNIDGSGTLEGNQLIVNSATMISGGGTLAAEGVVNMPRLTLGEFDIDATLNEFMAMDSEDFQHLVISGQVHLEGATNLPVVTGNVDVIGADIYLDNLLGADTLGLVSLTQQDLDELEAVFGFRATEADTSTFVLFDALATNINLEFNRDTWFRMRANPSMALQLEGQLDVQKQAYEDPSVFGDLSIVQGRSYVEQFGRRFDIESGQLVFQGDPAAFNMEIAAAYRVRSPQNNGEVTITLNLEGQIGQLETELGSDAGLDQTNILSYIATGRPANAAFDVTGIGSELAIAQLTSLIEGAAAEELGLDVVNVRFDPLRGPQLVAGEYVTQDLFVGVSQSFGSSDPASSGGSEQAATEVTLEYEIFDWLLLRLIGGQAGNQQTLRVNLQWEQAY